MKISLRRERCDSLVQPGIVLRIMTIEDSNQAMTTSASETRSAAPSAASNRAGPWQTIEVFAGWCLRREAPRWRPSVFRMTVLIPVALAWLEAATIWPDLRHPGMGAEATRQLLWLAAMAVFGGGVQFASKAVCWEVSPEMRDLVRLTGIEAKTLLWATTLSRWWTIGWSVLLMLPLAMFARTLGGVSSDQLLAGAYGLALLAALTGGFGMLAGVLTFDAKNPEKTASTATWLGLVIYNVGFVLLAQAIYWGNWLIAGNVSQSLDRLCQRIAYGAPVVSLANALWSPDLFTPSDPGYWLHFLTAIVCAALATVAIELRFRSSAKPADADSSDGLPSLHLSMTGGSDVEEGHSGPSGSGVEERTGQSAPPPGREVVAVRVVRPVASGRRPRCSDRPFFWKDVYVLSDERKWLNTWTLFYFAATIGVLLLGVVSLLLSVVSNDDSDRYLVVVVAIFSIVVAAIILALRFDALLTAEFRDRTWGSLMLLPVDPCDLLLTKLGATLYEQRFAALPVGASLIALVMLGPGEAIVGAGMTAVIAMLASGLLCQTSCINQLLGKAWWVGLCQAIGFIAVIVAASAIWLNCGLWPGFVLTGAFLSGIVLVVQFGCVNRLARNWVET